jgi:hypothetical protein
MSMVLNEERRELCISLAQNTLADYAASVGPARLPVPIGAIASWMGFQVIFLATVGESCSALVSTKEKLIGINAKHHRKRQRFSLGHELGHILLGHPPESRCNSKQIALYNSEADACAAELLMPREQVLRWTETTRNAAQLARIFDVSDEAMQVRLHELGIFTDLRLTATTTMG